MCRGTGKVILSDLRHTSFSKQNQKSRKKRWQGDERCVDVTQSAGAVEVEEEI